MFRLLFAILVFFTVIATGQARENHLKGAKSPYLLQHVENPVDWYPWGSEALKKAKAENKLIFISVGYSSCHWCHVMRDESFEDETIAAFLNKHFVSIKIDRESRPDLDEQFMLVTQLLTGTGGWPNSVFLTPDRGPFFAGGYFPPEEFLAILKRAYLLWQANPDLITQRSGEVTEAVKQVLAERTEAREVTPEMVRQAADSTLKGLDTFNGGYGIAPKFPRESLFLFLAEQAERTGDEHYLEAVTAMLDAMIKGGIHDHVGGGFHRYAVDPEWHVPHFEKMLYNQALIGRLLVRAYTATGKQEYRRSAERLFDYVLRELTSPSGGFYSAQDANSINRKGKSAEGAFYTWTPADLDELADEADFIRDIFQVSKEGELDGENVLNLNALPAELSAEHSMEKDAFVVKLNATLKKMRDLRNQRPKPFTDKKIVLSWNTVMIATLAEAATRLDRREYFEAAENAAGFILEKMQTPQGFNRVSFEGSTSIPGQLEDYAGLGLALVALHDHAPDRNMAAKWLNEASTIANEITRRFGSADNGYRITEKVDGIAEFIPVDDTEIPSGNAMSLALFTRLAHRAHLPKMEQEAYRLSARFFADAVSEVEARGFSLIAGQELASGETGIIRFAGKGAVRLELMPDPNSGKVRIGISIAGGWHINANQPIDEYSIATALTAQDGPDLAVKYPEPIIKSLSFADKPLALYEGELLLAVAEAKPLASKSRQLKLTLQACSDSICLEPEELTFTVWR